ncbi:MAG: flagellar basal body L-ring protein FlgH [Candidatus Caenarcaniphilales bacterium]|nr:flagellar basal body L-ring protein FlgH [Candidatus Caenarcaniphilales bacterium]
MKTKSQTKYKKLLLVSVLSLLLLSSSIISTPESKAVSLLQEGGLTSQTITASPRGFFETFLARNVGDVITVRVIENIDVLKRSEVRLQRDTNLDADFSFSQNMTSTSTLTPADNDIASMITQFTFPGQYRRNNDRSINVDNDETFTTLVSALIVEVDPQSNNMVVEGSRQIVIEGQTKSLYVRGIINPKDIDSNNEIPSYKLANAQVQIIGTGSLDKERDGGFLHTIFNFLI